MLHFSSKESINLSLLGELKQGLLSREPNVQVQAIRIITKSLTRDEDSGNSGLLASDILLDADITEFLCEAMATLHNSVMDALFVCLGHLTKNDKFFKNNHVLFVLESLLRATFSLLKRMEKSQALIKALELLAILLQGISKGGNVKPTFTINLSQVMGVLDFILHQWRNSDVDILVPVGLVLHGLLCNCSIAQQLDSASLNRLSTIVHYVFEQLSAYLCNCKSKEITIRSREVVSLNCHIIMLVVRLCSVLTSTRKEERKCDLQIINKHVNSMMKFAIDCLKNICYPYILSSKIEPSYTELYGNFFNCLKALYTNPMEEFDIHLLSNSLADNGFLIFIIVMSSWFSENCNWQRPVCLIVMVEFLVSLSTSTLEIARLWPNGIEDFRELLQTGVQLLPPDHTKWLQLLHYSNAFHPAQNAVLVLIFFCCLSLQKIEVMGECYPSLVLYLTTLPYDVHLPLPIVKVLWLSFAVCSLSYSKPLSVERAMDKLIQLLGQQVQLRDVYTHNPALLYWVFSHTLIPSFLQYQVMVLWLQEEQTASNKILVDLMLTSTEVTFCLLDVIQNSASDISNKATTVLKYAMTCLSPLHRDNISAILWDTLPHALVTLSSNTKPENANSACNLMQITSIAIPPSLSNTTVVRSAFLLSRVLVRLMPFDINIQKQFCVTAVTQALLLLLLSMEMLDKKVFELYANEPKFLNMLCEASTTKELDFKILAITFLYHLQNYRNKEELLKCENSMSIEGKMLLQLLHEKNLQVISVGIQLLHALLVARPKFPLLMIVDGINGYITAEFVQTLFLSLQNICAVNLVNISFTGWKCLSAILQFVSVHKMEITNLKNHLAAQPWTYVLIRLTLHSSLPFQNDSFLQFVNQWVQCHQSPQFPSSHIRRIEKGTRMPQPSLLSQTLSAVAVDLLKGDLSMEEPSKRNLILDTIRKILSAKAHLPDETIAALWQCIRENTH